MINWTERKVLTVESDDYGVCAWTANSEIYNAITQLDVARNYLTQVKNWVGGTLETPDVLERLFSFLEQYHGRDGRPANFVPCYGVANPDFASIKADGYREYHDIWLDEGVPGRWKRECALDKAREGMTRGVWVPEFHTRLHHANPYKWLQSVREGSPEARTFFEFEVFQCEERRPEYEDMSKEEQIAWIAPAIDRFRAMFARVPRAGVNSDATEVTEEVWRARGLKVRMFKQNSIEQRHLAPGDRLPMGQYRADIDMTMLNRNVFFEPLGSGDLDGPHCAREALRNVEANWAQGEPAIVSSHRKNYRSMVGNETQNGYDQAEYLYGELTLRHPDLHFLTTWEVAQMYRQGGSIEVFGDHAIARNWTDGELRVSEELVAGVMPGASSVLTDGGVVDIDFIDGQMAVIMLPGDYRIELLREA